MKEIAEKYPKGWEYVEEDFRDRHNADINDVKFSLVFGYLVLEFFPKYGIEIERLIMEDLGMCYGIHCKNLTWQEELKIPLFKLPEDAITKAAEIRERQLEGGGE